MALKATKATPKKVASTKVLTATKTVAQSENIMVNTASETILAVWGKSKEERNAEELQMNFQLLQADAETALIQAKGRVNAAKKAYSDAMHASAKKPSFTSIAEAALILEKEELVLSKAVATFTNLFGSTPSIAK
jgi:hypothetical protein